MFLDCPRTKRGAFLFLFWWYNIWILHTLPPSVIVLLWLLHLSLLAGKGGQVVHEFSVYCFGLSLPGLLVASEPPEKAKIRKQRAMGSRKPLGIKTASLLCLKFETMSLWVFLTVDFIKRLNCRILGRGGSGRCGVERAGLTCGSTDNRIVHYLVTWPKRLVKQNSDFLIPVFILQRTGFGSVLPTRCSVSNVR